MIPMGIGMASVNAGVLYLSAKTMGTIFIDPIASGPEKLLDVLQIDFLQPIYTFTFSNGLIACLVFMGIGAISDIGYMLIAPIRCMIIAIMAELGTMLTFPIAVAMGLTYKEAAAIAMVGGADAPMVLYTSLLLARDLFVPITIVAYLYLSLTYAGYPYLVRLLIPKHLRGIKMDQKTIPNISPAKRSLSPSSPRTCFACCSRWRRPCSCRFSSASSSANPASSNMWSFSAAPCFTAPLSSSASCSACCSRPTPFSIPR